MRVLSCIVGQHNLWLVLLAAVVCVAGSWVALRLLLRATDRHGVQRSGWLFLAAVAAGSSVWCTHFIAMLAYDATAPVTFEPILTMQSLLIAIAGMGAGFWLALYNRLPPEIGGAIAGLSVAAMHYTGMAAYHVDGVIAWNMNYVVASVVLSVVIISAAVGATIRGTSRNSLLIGLGAFVGGIVSLHFTGMTAVSVTPFVTGAPIADATVFATMAVAVAGVALMVVGTGVASHLIDSEVTHENIAALRHLAMTDSLTDLPNRTGFNEYLHFELQRAEQGGRSLALIGIDLDKFKEINDLRGHEAGDEALKTIGRRLLNLSRGGEFVARIGGDEFAALKRFRNDDDLREFIQRLEEALFKPLTIEDLEITCGASLGIAIYPQDGRDAERLIGNADLAMYRAKADLTRTVCYYEPQMDEKSRERRGLAMDLRSAIEHKELELKYQVQKSVESGEVRGYEVLLRWKHPERGYIPPSEFIPIAEESGSILAIGEWVMREAAREALAWPLPHKIAVNVSPVQLMHVDLARSIHEILLETGLPPRRLEIEITESTIIADKVRSLDALRRIRALGVTVAIDDFGTGYSSLDTLRSFPFDKIKLDSSFMKEIETSQQARAIIRAVLALGKSLDIKVLAEGVETGMQLEILRSEGCHEVQGFLLGAPETFVADVVAVEERRIA
ncbi:bifunctional diguanylate cyclase/phosphodiesterase [Terrihabitans soli]|uniref:Bifunctional diguanylate cyclase/phosphodiesterase n=1 Tax=Terrihabitans soli TaxID=708113 RepID=A0A6S6QXI9_9HYPH|nr:bifunctional diguanylate cyclase/phosphodiesterase [Terrihabitans soli]BCJ91992.1 bifunctional diguanylate cyclase/phosphodiesterase [Terrihabitans soli]